MIAPPLGSPDAGVIMCGSYSAASVGGTSTNCGVVTKDMARIEIGKPGIGIMEGFGSEVSIEKFRCSRRGVTNIDDVGEELSGI